MRARAAKWVQGVLLKAAWWVARLRVRYGLVPGLAGGPVVRVTATIAIEPEPSPATLRLVKGGRG